VLPKLPPELPVRWRPFFPLPSFSNFPELVEGKRRYLIRDVVRLTKHYGVGLQFPRRDDVDWTAPHAAFLAAEERGRGPAFALAVYEARFGRGEHVEDRDVLARAAEAAQLDPSPILAAAADAARRRALADEVQRAFDEDGVFGVPTLILPDGTRFWGHDRMEQAIREGWITAAEQKAS
jgi:2-hydroxychromene-2-carboxylate isomerase